MSLPEVVSREEWLVARKALLVREKELTRLRDQLAADRRRMPMVRVDQPYVFQGPQGEVTLLDMFDGRRQLILRHFMFGPDWEAGCPSCTAAIDEMSDGLLRHLAARQTSFAVVSRAPLARLEAYQKKHGWTIPWYSSFGSPFNYDYHVTLDESVAPMEYNYRAEGLEGDQPMERPGESYFLRDGDTVYHTNSIFARGTEQTGGCYYFLDMTALGRQEEWEEPKGRSDTTHANVPNFAQAPA